MRQNPPRTQLMLEHWDLHSPSKAGLELMEDKWLSLLRLLNIAPQPLGPGD